jgi:hypothetical protein
MVRMTGSYLHQLRATLLVFAIGVASFGSPDARAADAPTTTGKPAAEKPAEKPEDSKPLLSEEDLMIQSRIAMEQISAAKERSFRSKAALADLKAEAVASDSGQNSALVTLVHRNELDSSLALVGVSYSLDGTPLFAREEAAGHLDRIGEQAISTARVLPGSHVLLVQYDLRGRGGLFSSMGSDVMTVAQKYIFKIEPRRTTTISSTLFNTGSQTRPLKEQVEIAFSQRGIREPPKTEEQAPEAPPSVPPAPQ